MCFVLGAFGCLLTVAGCIDACVIAYWVGGLAACRFFVNFAVARGLSNSIPPPRCCLPSGIIAIPGYRDSRDKTYFDCGKVYLSLRPGIRALPPGKTGVVFGFFSPPRCYCIGLVVAGRGRSSPD